MNIAPSTGHTAAENGAGTNSARTTASAAPARPSNATRVANGAGR
jgi:hypothetical protein